MSRSTYMFTAFAPPADNVPPTSVSRTNRHPGQPPSANTIVGIVVMRSNSMMRGLVSAMYAPILDRDGLTCPSCADLSREGTRGRVTTAMTPTGYGSTRLNSQRRGIP
jgi:hypothetical protein